MRVFNVEKLQTHGGSLRIYGCHSGDSRKTSQEVDFVLGQELAAGLKSVATYTEFQNAANRVKDDFLTFLLQQKKMEKKVVAYGAAAKGNTLMNFAGIKPDLIPFVCDAAKSKCGKFMPGSHIPILSESMLQEYKPDYVVIFPWNLRAELERQLAYIKNWGGRLVMAVPELTVI